jgi:predicted dehydrogenase
MGRLHARVYSQTERARLVGVYDANPDKAEAVAAEFGCAALPSLGAALEVAKAVTIAVPTNFHLATAEPFLRKRVACLIEKPLAKDVAEARRIVELAREHGAVVQVGHIERFNPAVRAMERLDIRPRFIEVVRVSPLTFRSIDVGVVLDMMIHDIDIVLRLAASRVERIDSIGVSVIGAGPAGEPVEDICNARIVFENGCVANLTASRLALRTERRMRVFSTEAYVSIDYQKKYGVVARRSGNLEAIRSAVARIRSGEVQDLSGLNFADLVNIEELEIDDTEPLRAEIDAFLDAVGGNASPAASAEDGLAAVELATRIVASIAPRTLTGLREDSVH